MEISELKNKLEAIRKDAERQKSAVIIEYCKANNPYKVGDVFEDHIGKIKIALIGYSHGSLSLGTNPCCIYTGVILTKNNEPTRKGQSRMAWQSNEIKKQTK